MKILEKEDELFSKLKLRVRHKVIRKFKRTSNAFKGSGNSVYYGNGIYTKKNHNRVMKPSVNDLIQRFDRFKETV